MDASLKVRHLEIIADRRMDHSFGGNVRACIRCIRSCNMFSRSWVRSVVRVGGRVRTSGNRSRSTNRPTLLWWQYQAKAEIRLQPHVFRSGDLK